MSRVACVRVEAFAAAALERCEPALREQPLAVVVGTPPVTRVVEANARARAEGVGPGLSEAEALVRCPTLVRRPASREVEAAARHALLDACLAVSPRLEDAAPGIVHVDLGGLRRLFGEDAEIGRRLGRHARAVGLEARVGIASSRAAAGVAARVGPAVHALPPAGEQAALAAVPLSTLAWPVELAAAFRRWGLVTLGDLAALPRAAERAVDAQPQLFQIERLLYVVAGAELHRAHRLRDGSVAGHHDDRQIRILRQQVAEHVEAAAVRQPEVEERDVGGRLRRDAASLGDAGGVQDVEVLAREGSDEVPGEDGLVLYDEHGGHLRHSLQHPVLVARRSPQFRKPRSRVGRTPQKRGWVAR